MLRAAPRRKRARRRFMTNDEQKWKKFFENDPDLNEFPSPTYEEWKEAATAALKGAPFEKKLLTRTPEGITLDPIYNADDAAELPHAGGLPGAPPFARGSYALGAVPGGWAISQEVACPTPREANSVILHEAARGCDGVNLLLDAAAAEGRDPDEAGPGEVGACGVSVSSLGDLETLLEGVDPGIPIRIDCGLEAMPMLGLYAARCEKAGVDTASVSGCIGADPLGHMVSTGEIDRDLDGVFARMATLAPWAREAFGDLRTVVVSGKPYHEAGGSAVEELGYAMATGVEYMREMTSRGVSPDHAAEAVEFEYSVGSSFFIEIAKLRAARVLWAMIADAFGANAAASRMRTHATTSRWSMTLRDPWVNILRGATEAFSAVVGGADSVANAPFDSLVGQPNYFSRRVARNSQSVLKDESRLGWVVDPAGGSWYVESVTDEVARGAWKIVQDVEEAGGMAAALEKGTPQRAVRETAAQRAGRLNTRRSVLVGTNMYANLLEELPRPPQVDLESIARSRSNEIHGWRTGGEAVEHQAALEKLAALMAAGEKDVAAAAAGAARAGATLGEITRVLAPRTEGRKVDALRRTRAAVHFEEMRRETDAMAATDGGRPKVFLANMGPIPQHKARADFTRGFFEVGGFEVIGNDGFATPLEAAEAARESGADISVVCSTDPTYPELVPPYVKAVKEANPAAKVILAGYPKDQVEAHREAGVDDFIHIKADNYAILSGLLERKGGAR